MKLAAQQTEAYDKIMAFLESDEQRFVLGGYAGTGKSTLSSFISDQVGSTMHCAYTGKAANVLREKGNSNASTIHGALYKLVGEEYGEPHFTLNDESDMKHCDLVIVDEYSMLPKEVIDDIEGLANKVLYLGDPFQLPPVHGDCILQPDFFLTEIHRQALESPILRHATAVREGNALAFCNDGEFIYQPKSYFHADDYEQADQIIVGYNDTRKAWNKRFREKMGFAGQEFPCQGDKIICTRNNHEIGLFNGMIGECTGDARRVSFQELKMDFDAFKGVPVWDGNFKGREEKDCIGKDKKLNRFDFAYAITGHKSQGSEFDNVLIYNQPIGKTDEERRRWLYTTITRGKNSVKLVSPGGKS